MNSLRKYFFTGLLVTGALLAGAFPAWAAQVSLGAASNFAALGGTNVTCTAGSVVTGDVGVSPGSVVPYTNTGCTIAGAVPPATNAAAAQARLALISAYAAIQLLPCTAVAGTLAAQSLAPGVYCIDSVAKAGTLTLTGPAAGVWVFRVNGDLTGTDFSVVMAGGGLPCNVFWAPSGAATLTDSLLKGNILAGDATVGSITVTGGTLAGRALARVAVTMTAASVIGCGALSGSGSCSSGDGNDGNDGDEDDNNKDDNKDNKKCDDNGSKSSNGDCKPGGKGDK
jgi:hypothetical protein